MKMVKNNLKINISKIIKLKIIVSMIFILFIFSGCSIIKSDGTSSQNTQSGDGNYATNTSTPTSDNTNILDKGPVKGGKLRLFSTTLDTVNPILTKNRFEVEFQNLIFEKLITFDFQGKPKGVLCDKWTVTKNGLEWNFHIRQGVYWHDGQPLTADDVEYSLKLMLSPQKDKAYRYDYSNMSGFSAIDRSNFRVNLIKPNYFTAEMMSFPIVQLNSFNAQNPNMLSDPLSKFPNGTGLYKVQNITKDIIELIPNTEWWGNKDIIELEMKKPLISEIQILLNTKSSNLIDNFKTDKIDLMNVKNSEYGKYTGRADIVQAGYTSRDFEYLVFNLSRAPFKDHSLRQAVAQAIDNKKLKDQALKGDGVPASLPVIPESWIYSNSIKTINPTKRNVVDALYENGWNNYGGQFYKMIDGVSHSANFEILVNSENEIRCEVANNLSNMLKAAGLSVSVKKVTWNEEQNLLKIGQYDCVILGCRVSELADMSFFFTGDPTQNQYLGYNRYQNQNLNKLLNTISTSSDEFVRKSAFSDAAAILDTELPFKGLFYYKENIIYNKKIRITADPNAWNNMEEIEDWYISNY